MRLFYNISVTGSGCAVFAGVSAGAAGSNTVKVLPSPSLLSMLSRPWWRLTMCLTMASPSPVPPRSRDALHVHPVEALGQAGDGVGGNAFAIVTHRDHDLGIRAG